MKWPQLVNCGSSLWSYMQAESHLLLMGLNQANRPDFNLNRMFFSHDQTQMSTNSDTFRLAHRTRLFVQYTTSLSSLCKLIWRHWTYEMPVRYILSGVWVRLSMFSPLSIIQYVFSLSISLVMIEIIYILCLIIIIKSEVWTITHCLGLGHETMVSAVCLSIFLQ